MPRPIEGATLDHAGRIAPNLRLADRLEITRASGLDLLEDLKVQSTAPTWALRGPYQGRLGQRYIDYPRNGRHAP